jgi:hypothetical protein
MTAARRDPRRPRRCLPPNGCSRRWRTFGDSPSPLPGGGVKGQIDLFCKTVVVRRNLQCTGLGQHKKERPPRGGPRSSSTEVRVSRLGKPLASTCDNAQSQYPRSPRASPPSRRFWNARRREAGDETPTHEARGVAKTGSHRPTEKPDCRPVPCVQLKKIQFFIFRRPNIH